MKVPLVSVIIPCLNEGIHIQGTLDALAIQDFDDFEIIIVDGGSIDTTLDAISNWQRENPKLQLHVLNNPSRFTPHGLNLGISAAQGKVIARLDGHMQPQPNYLGQCVKALAQPDIGVCGGTIEIWPGAPGMIAQAIAIATSTPLGAGDAQYRLGARNIQEVDTVPFACFLKSTWAKVGGFAESLLANEDYDFNFRVRKAGWKIRLDPAIHSIYYARSTYQALAGQYGRYGWWKAKMLGHHPQSLRWRQAIPAIWAVCGPIFLGFAIGLAWSWAWIPWALYVVILVIESIRHSSGNILLALAIFNAYVILHFAWGWGCWSGWIASALEAA